jgi:hypothetical protein
MLRDYADDVERVKKKYEKRIKRILNGIAKELRSAHWKVGRPYEMSDDEQYEWWMYVSRYDAEPEETRDDDIDIRFAIAESVVYDGTEDGINFTIDVTTVGGEVVGGIAPYNFTHKVWVPLDDPEAIEERFELVESLHPSGMVDLLTDHELRY